MSFFGKFKSNATPANPSKDGPVKKDHHSAASSALEKHIADIAGPTRADGSDKFFGFENYSSTCYCNSVLQCLYFSEPFRKHVIDFPPSAPPTNGLAGPDGSTTASLGPPRAPLLSKPPPGTPGPLAANSPARRPIVTANSAQAQNQKADEKDSPEWKKKMLMQTALMLDMQLDYSDTYGMQESLFTALKDIFEAIISQTTDRTGIVSPHKLLEILRRENEMFRSAMHQDAHEFLNLLLNQVVDTVDLYEKQHNESVISHALTNGDMTGMTKPAALTRVSSGGWVHDLFEGTLVSETRCLTCETVSRRDEAFMDLSVDLEAHSSVTSCLRKFSEEEMLCERNKFHCDNCGGLQEAEKRMKISRLPRILALHLKRFKYTEDFNRLQKLFHRVTYPFHLRLFNTTDDAVDQDRIYELYAVVVHIGGGPYHGHYVSIVKTQDHGWLLFDDELVEPVSKSYVLSFFGGEAKPGAHDARQLACAYVLFYQETTLEAVEREQEAEAAAAAAASAPAAAPEAVGRKSDVSSPVLSGPTSLWANGLRAMTSVTTPTEEKDDALGRLAQVMSTLPASSPVSRHAPEPSPVVPSAPSVPPLPTNGVAESSVPPKLSPQKSRRDLRREDKGGKREERDVKKDLKREEKDHKRDLKREEKERKREEKEAAKEAERMRKERTKGAIERRRNLREKADADMNAALEASLMSKAEDDGRRHSVLGVTSSPAATAGAAALSSGPGHTSSGSGGIEDFAAANLAHSVTTGDLRGDTAVVLQNSATPVSPATSAMPAASSNAGGGLLGSRFRPASMSLRQKKGFWGSGGGGSSSAKKDDAPPTISSPLQPESPHLTSDLGGANGDVLGRQDSVSRRHHRHHLQDKDKALPATPGPASAVPENGGNNGSPRVGSGSAFGFNLNIKRNSTVKEKEAGGEERKRFTMGRKKSAVFS